MAWRECGEICPLMRTFVLRPAMTTVIMATIHRRSAFKGHEGAVWSVAFSPDGAHVLTGLYDTTTRHSDGARVLIESRGKPARLWDAATGQELRAFNGHQGTVASVAFSPDGARVLTMTTGGTFFGPQ